MGQRLVITVHLHGQDIAALYYHWSAYSVSALHETREVIKCLFDKTNPIKDVNEARLRLVRFCEKNGGGIAYCNGNEHDRIQKMYPDQKFKAEGYSRNNGLVALSPEGMEDLQGWSEGDVFINLDSGTVLNCVGFEETLEGLMSWRHDITKLEDIPEYPASFIEFDINDIDKEIEAIENAPDTFRDGRRIYSLIA